MNKKTHLLLALFAILCQIVLANESSMSETWENFRANHPYGYQTVGLRHEGDNCIFVISEPSESLSKDAIGILFKQYGGTSIIKQKEFGYDGWLSDVVGEVKFANKEQEGKFIRDLFMLLYGTDYKAFCIDLDNPSKHVYYSPYKLNYSISAAELYSWFIDKYEQLQDGSGVKDNLYRWLLSNKMVESNKLLFSTEAGFVVWLIDTQRISANDKLFKTNARKFAVDTDLIIGAFGKKKGRVAIVARERAVPIAVLPPLRVETITLLATTTNETLAQSYERHNVFAGKLKGNKDFAPIYLSDELWHTEYGNLLNVTDQMLKSWSENGEIGYYHFNYPKPIDWAFYEGALSDLGTNQLTYNWNTKGAGYIVEDELFDIYAINRTGSLPVSYFPDDMEGRVEEKVYDAEELAYDFFSQLNNPELVRVVQYAAFYQILTYFKNITSPTNATTKDSSVPNYRVFDGYIENILRLVDENDNTGIYHSQMYKSGFERFKKRYNEANDISDLLTDYLENDEYGEFGSYLKEQLDEKEYQQLFYGTNDATTEEIYREYIDANVDSVRAYINRFKQKYGNFPFAEASKFIVSPRELSKDIEAIETQKRIVSSDYDRLVNTYYENLESLDQESKTLYDKIKPQKLSSFVKSDLTKLDQSDSETINKYFENIKQNLYEQEEESDDIYERILNRLKKMNDDGTSSYFYRDELIALISEWNKNQKLAERIIALQPTVEAKVEPFNKKEERIVSLQVSDKLQKAIGALNWLLTDASPYEEPSGPFYTSKLTVHKQWIRSPIMTCSFTGTGYGGHNLDSHVTPIKTSTNIAKGKCKVSFDKKGNRIISVAEKDKKSITPEVLRYIERRIIKEETIDLSQFTNLVPRSKTAVIKPLEKRSMRGLDTSQQIENVANQETAYQRGLEGFIGDRKTVLASTEKESEVIKCSSYSEREVQIEYDGHRYVFDRDGKNMEFDFNNISDEIAIDESNNEYNMVTLSQKPETITNQDFSEVKLVIRLPKEIPTDEFKELVSSYSSKQKNRFTFFRYIELKLKNYNREDIQRETRCTLRALILDIELYKNDTLINEYSYVEYDAA